MTHLVFLDTETTSLRPDRRAWEIGLIVRRPLIVKHPDGPDTYETDDYEHHWFIGAGDLDLGNADPFSLQVGRFYDRHPEYSGSNATAHLEEFVLRKVEMLTRGAHLVGAVPNFDAEVLGARMRAHGILPSWHYHLICCENLAAGWLSAFAATLESRGESECLGPARAAELRRIAAPPWNSEELSRAVGVDPDDFDRHTALSDAKWALAIYDTVTGGAL